MKVHVVYDNPPLDFFDGPKIVAVYDDWRQAGRKLRELKGKDPYRWQYLEVQAHTLRRPQTKKPQPSALELWAKRKVEKG